MTTPQTTRAPETAAPAPPPPFRPEPGLMRNAEGDAVALRRSIEAARTSVRLADEQAAGRTVRRGRA